MACSTMAAPSLLLPSSTVADPSSLACSSSPFLASALPVAPLNRPAAAAAFVSARCSVSNENQSSSKATARREILAGLASAGAALAVFSGSSLAAIGPGTSGAERTAKKADELLKAADKLNIEDAPKRFGPGRIEGDGGKIAQQAGSGAVKSLQQGAGDAAKEASGSASGAVKSVQQGFGGDVAKEASGKASGAVKSVQEGVPGDLGKEASKAAGEIEKRTKNIFGQFVARKDSIGSAAKDVVGQAQKKGSEISGGGGGFFGSIKQTVKGIEKKVPSLPQGPSLPQVPSLTQVPSLPSLPQ